MGIVDSLQNMIDRFKNSDFFIQNIVTIRMLCYQQYSLYLFGLKQKFTKSEHKKLVNKFIDFFKKNFPDEKEFFTNVPNIKYLEIGCKLWQDNIYCSANRHILKNVTEYLLKPHYCDYVKDNIITDYIIDFSSEFDQENINSSNYTREIKKWEVKCWKLINKLGERHKGNIFLIMHKEKLGIYKEYLDFCNEYFKRNYNNVLILIEGDTQSELLEQIVKKGNYTLDNKSIEDIILGSIRQEKEYLPNMDFLFNDNYRLSMNNNLLYMWLKLKLENKNISTYFKNKNIKSIAIYGLGYLGECLYRELKDSNIDIGYIIDKNHSGKKMEEMKMIYPDEIEEQYPVDVIVITTVKVYDEVSTELLQKTNIKTVSLQEVVDYFDK